MLPTHFENPADTDFDAARRRALVEALLDRLRRAPRDLLPFAEVRSRLVVRGQHDRGIQTVPLAAIVGSQGRYRDFDTKGHLNVSPIIPIGYRCWSYA